MYMKVRNYRMTTKTFKIILSVNHVLISKHLTTALDKHKSLA